MRVPPAILFPALVIGIPWSVMGPFVLLMIWLSHYLGRAAPFICLCCFGVFILTALAIWRIWPEPKDHR
jgi:hypothetical protein